MVAFCSAKVLYPKRGPTLCRFPADIGLTGFSVSLGDYRLAPREGRTSFRIGLRDTAFAERKTTIASRRNQGRRSSRPVGLDELLDRAQQEVGVGGVGFPLRDELGAADQVSGVVV